MKQFDAELIRTRIRDVARREMELPEAVANDVAFHMTDWLDDLDAYHRFCADPSSVADADLSRLLMFSLSWQLSTQRPFHARSSQTSTLTGRFWMELSPLWI
jgi:hypothetical protein